MDVNPFLESSFLGTVVWWTHGACCGYGSQVQHINHGEQHGVTRWAGSVQARLSRTWHGSRCALATWEPGQVARGLSFTSTAPQGSPRAEQARGQAPHPQQPSEPTLRLSGATHS